MLGIGLNSDNLFDEITILRRFMGSPAAATVPEKELWRTFFQKVGLEDVPNLFRLLAHVMTVSSSNAFCESVFSTMNFHWTDSRNQLSVAILRSEICIKHNFDYSCTEFYRFVKKKPDVLKFVKSETKYKFKKK